MLADALDLPATYDAHYLALAEHLGCELWTDDQRLIRHVATSLPFVRWIGDHPATVAGSSTTEDVKSGWRRTLRPWRSPRFERRRASISRALPSAIDSFLEDHILASNHYRIVVAGETAGFASIHGSV